TQPAFCALLPHLFGRFLLGDRFRMIRNRQYLRLIYRGRSAGLGERRSSRNDPLFRSRRAGVSSAGLDAAWVDVLFRLASRDVELHVDRALRRQVLTPFLRTSIPDDDQLGVWILLQLECNIVQFGLAGVIDAPRFLLVRIRALVHLGGLRWRRWRIFNRHRAPSRSRQAARVGTSCADTDRTRRGAGSVQGGGGSAARNTAAARGPSAHRNRNVIRTGAGATDRGVRTGLDHRRIRRAGNPRRVLGWFLHDEGRHAAGLAALPHLGIGDMGRNRVAAARHAIGGNARSIIFAGNLAAGAAPCVI